MVVLGILVNNKHNVLLKKWEGEIVVFNGVFGDRRVAEFRKWGVDDIA